MASVPLLDDQNTLEIRSLADLKNWRSFFQHLGTNFWLWNLEDDSLDLPDEWLQDTGYTAEDVATGQEWLKLLHPSDAAEVETLSQACIDGSTDVCEQEFRIRRGDGNYDWYRARYRVVMLEDTEPTRFMIGVYTNINTVRKTRHALEENENRWNQALKGSNVGVWDWDLQTDEVYFSPEWIRMLEFVDKDLEPSIDSWRRIAMPEDLAESDQAIARYLAGETTEYRCECRVRCKDGQIKWVLDRGVITERAQDGRPLRMVGTHDDITEAKVREAAVRESSEHLKQITKMIPGFVYQGKRWPDGRACMPYASDGITAICGIAPEEVADSTDPLWEFVHPDDRQRMQDLVVEAYDNETGWDDEYRIVLPDGEVRWLMNIANADPNRDADGALTWYGYIADITETKLREAEIEKSRDQLKLVVSTTPGFIFQYKLRPDGTSCFPFTSDGINEIYGFGPETVADDAAPIIEAIHPDDHERVMKSIVNFAEKGIAWDQEYRSVHKNGEVLWLRGVANRNPEADADGSIVWHGYVNDITASKAREAALRESLERLDSIAAMVPGFVYQYKRWPDQSESFPYVSEGILDVYALTSAEAKHNVKTLWNRTDPRDRALVDNAIERSIASGTGWTLEYRIVLPGGKTRWIRNLANRRAGHDADQAVTWYGYMSDITKQKEADLTFERRARAIELANEDLEQFNYVAAHDLKEPLRAIRHLTEWIEEDLGDDVPDPVANNLERMRGRVERLGHLVEDLAAYSRAGRKAASTSTVNLKILVEEVAMDIDARGCEVITDGVPEENISTSAVSLKTVLKNLITNAAVHHDEADKGTITVAAIPFDEHILFHVEDDGPGIGPEHHERIFRMYQRLDPEHNPTGSGSGLAIVKRTLSSIDAQITITSPVSDRGTRFSFDWPRAWPTDL